MVNPVLNLMSNTKASIRNDTSPGIGLFEENGILYIGQWFWNPLNEIGGCWQAPLSVVNYINLGSDPLARMRVSNRNALADILSIERTLLPDSNLADIISHYILGTLADPTGIFRVKPLRINRNGFKFKIGSFGTVIQEKFSTNHPNWDATLKVRLSDYRRHKSNGLALNILQKWTGYDSLKYFGRNPTSDDLDKLLPPEFREDGSITPETVITDNFNRSDADALGTSSEGWSWTEVQGDIDIVSNEANCTTGTESYARAESALSSADQYVQANLLGSGSNKDAGLIARKDGTATHTYYLFWALTGTAEYRIYRRSAGTYTQIQSGGTGITSGDLIKGEILDDDLTLFENGVQEITIPDTLISGNLYTGIRASVGASRWDNFEAGDLSAGIEPYPEAFKDKQNTLIRM